MKQKCITVIFTQPFVVHSHYSPSTHDNKMLASELASSPSVSMRTISVLSILQVVAGSPPQTGNLTIRFLHESHSSYITYSLSGETFGAPKTPVALILQQQILLGTEKRSVCKTGFNSLVLSDSLRAVY